MILKYTYQCDVVKRNCTEEIDGKSTSEVLLSNYFSVSDLFTTIIIENGCSEHDEDIEHKNKINSKTSHIEDLVLDSECNTDREHEHIVASSNHDQEVPVFLETR